MLLKLDLERDIVIMIINIIRVLKILIMIIFIKNIFCVSKIINKFIIKNNKSKIINSIKLLFE